MTNATDNVRFLRPTRAKPTDNFSRLRAEAQRHAGTRHKLRQAVKWRNRWATLAAVFFAIAAALLFVTVGP